MTTRQPEALRLAEMLTANEWPGHVTLVSYARECVAELRAQHARITELEAQLEAVGAGGVGPLIACAGFSAAEPENIRGILARCRDFIDTTKAPAYPAGADLADEIDVLLAAQPAPRAHALAYAALPESFLEIPDVQDESGINAYYSREAVLECIDAALASHGQAPAGANENAKLVTLIAKCRDAFPIPAHGDPIENYWSAAIEDPANVPAYLQEIAKRKQAASVLYDPKAVLDVFNSARAGSDKSSGYLRGILAVIAHWESRPEPHRWMVPVQADSVQEDAARYRWLREQSSTLFVNISINGEGAEIAETLDSAVDAARKQGASQ